MAFEGGNWVFRWKISYQAGHIGGLHVLHLLEVTNTKLQFDLQNNKLFLILRTIDLLLDNILDHSDFKNETNLIAVMIL